MATLDVSIHASRGGLDCRAHRTHFRRSSFNPRVPRGTRLMRALLLSRILRFQSTRPAGDATPI